jgi:hypothetical protein
MAIALPEEGGSDGRPRLLIGLRVTGRHFFRNLFGWIRGKPTVFTVMFPSRTSPSRRRSAACRCSCMHNGKGAARLRPVRVGGPVDSSTSCPARPRTRSSATQIFDID